MAQVRTGTCGDHNYASQPHLRRRRLKFLSVPIRECQ